MGCINSKLVDDEYDDGPGVQPVFAPAADVLRGSADHRGGGGGGDGEGVANSDGFGGEPADDADAGRKNAQQQQQQEKAKSCRFRFDHRVTAKYDIKALIGRGSFSRVVRVENKVTKQPYAIKMIDRTLGKDVFEAELSVLRRVKHPNVILLVEVFESKDKVYMVMELATGGDLLDRIISKGYFAEKDAASVVRMVLSGLKYLHSLGITHRDLKPENLLYYHPGHDSRIMITDFGLSAAKRTSDEFMQTTCGTPEYIAPEILARKPYSSLVDLWAVGVIAYILLSGTMPFDDDNRTRLYRQILKAKYSYVGERWTEVSIGARDFIDHLLVLEPDERLNASEALQHEWLAAALRAPAPLGGSGTQRLGAVQRQCSSTKANSVRSERSSRSDRSVRSLRSEHRRVHREEIDELHRDPDFVAELGRGSTEEER